MVAPSMRVLRFSEAQQLHSEGRREGEREGGFWA